MSVASLAGRIQHLAKASSVLTKAEVEEVGRIGELGKDVLCDSAALMLRQAGKMPVLFQY